MQVIQKGRGDLILKITPKEQDVLYAIMCHIAGDVNGPRAVADELMDILEENGVNQSYADFMRYKTNDFGDNVMNMADKWPESS